MSSDVRADEAFRHKRTETALLKDRVGALLRRYAPLPWYLLLYSRSSSKIRSKVTRGLTATGSGLMSSRQETVLKNTHG